MNHVSAPDRARHPPPLSTFLNDDGYDQLVVALAIPFAGLCDQPTGPIAGTVHIGYLPAELMLGGATLGRLVEFFAARPQSQAGLTQQIAAHLDTHLRPRGVGVVLEAGYSGLAPNNVRGAGPTSITSALTGTLRTVPSCRREFFALIRRSR